MSVHKTSGKTSDKTVDIDIVELSRRVNSHVKIYTADTHELDVMILHTQYYI